MIRGATTIRTTRPIPNPFKEMKMRRPTPFLAILLALALTLQPLAAPEAAAQEAEADRLDLVIADGRILDGTGNPWFEADVGVRDGRIVAVGDLSDRPADRVLDAEGKWVTPGFIDLHSHAGDPGRDDDRGLTSPDRARRAAPNLVAQGVTTVVVNQDGRSPWPIREQRQLMEERGIGPNAALLVGHGAVRSRVMEDDVRRPATAEETEEMAALVRQAMEEGAHGLSAAHEYSPMRWATTDEIVALVEQVKPYGGVYVVHERSSGAEPMWWWPSRHDPGPPTMLDAVGETIEVAERTGVPSVQTHIKARGADFWGSSHAMVLQIERARERGVPIWADQYPYNTTGSDGRTVLIPPLVREAARAAVEDAGEAGETGGAEEAADVEDAEDPEPDYAAALGRLMEDPDTAALIRRDVRHEMDRRGGPGNLLILDHPDEDQVGRTLRELAEEDGIDPVEAAIRLQLEGDPNQAGGARLRGFSLSEYDVETFAARPWVATASDAGIALPEDGFVHPRYYGTFPRKLRRYAMEEEVLSVEDAVRSMTSLPARILGLRDRGLIHEGHHADLVVMDPERIHDRATALEPHQYPDGVEAVLVGGTFVVDGGERTGALPGRVITP
jgi:N-acyl-D-amino-acid deacylase